MIKAIFFLLSLFLGLQTFALTNGISKTIRIIYYRFDQNYEY